MRRESLEKPSARTARYPKRRGESLPFQGTLWGQEQTKGVRRGKKRYRRSMYAKPGNLEGRGRMDLAGLAGGGA